MSSRGLLVQSGPQTDIYHPRTVPDDPLELPEYINDELFTLGGMVNNILEGGALPPQSKLPKRYKEGMLYFFKNKVEIKDNLGNVISTPITGPGLWLYMNIAPDDPNSKPQWHKVFPTT